MIAAAGLTFLLLIGGASESQAPASRLMGRPVTVEGVEVLPRLTGDGRAGIVQSAGQVFELPRGAAVARQSG
ncbi:MAG: hypothetical protein EON88_33970, partial [Brevundimonas sp.]